VSRVGRVLGVARSGYYEGLGRPPSAHARVAPQVQEEGPRDLAPGRGTYGTRRSKHQLAQEGLRVSRRRTGRVLVQSGPHGKTRRRFKAPGDAGQAQTLTPNQRHRELTVSVPDTAYVGDRTSLPTGDGWLYLAGVLD
jgi:putative transposase